MISVIIWNIYLWEAGREGMIDLPDLYQELGREARLSLTEICIDRCSVRSGLKLIHVFTGQSACVKVG